MENKKTPEQWFQMLKEPYRSEAIKGINIYLPDFKKYPYSLEEALFYCILFDKEAGLTPTRNDWRYIYESIKAGETTYLEPETLKPEQMESGKWYVIFTKDLFTEWLIKFDLIQENRKVMVSKCYDLTDNCDWTSPCNSSLSNEHDIKSIRPATKEEVLKYFPDEVFEPIELRPEDLVSGEVYTMVDKETKDKWTIKLKTIDLNIDSRLNNNIVCDMYVHKTGAILKHHKCTSHYNNIYHATPEEKKLLLGEEQTDWESKYNELKVENDSLKVGYKVLNEKYDELRAKYEKLELEHKEIKMYSDDLFNKFEKNHFELNELRRKTRTNPELEPKGEKVYIHYNIKQEKWLQAESLELALQESPENKNIYEGYCIGKKKSVLVSETT